MKVKKIDPSWMPNEKPELKVGETIEITNPRRLILDGKVVAINEETGAEVGAYDLYGVIVGQEKDDFQEFLRLKKEKGLRDSLKKEAVDLQAQLDKVQEEKKLKKEVKK